MRLSMRTLALLRQKALWLATGKNGVPGFAGFRKDAPRLAVGCFTGLLAMTAIGTVGCAHVTPRLWAPTQPDGWSAQPISIARRFAPDAELDPVTRTPVGDTGYYLYILTKGGNWDYSNTRSFLLSHLQEAWGHCWLILESPGNRLECGLNGNFGLKKPTYAEGVNQKLRDGDPNPISYMWETMSDGVIEIGNGNRTPTFVWRMPITRQRHQRIHEYVMKWKLDRIGLMASNCVDLVTGAGELAGINLIHRTRLTLPPETKILWKRLRIWTDPQYRIIEYSTPDVLEVDLRQLAQFGIGSDVTEWYLASNMAASKSKGRGMACGRSAEKTGGGL